ncbi:MAG: dTMP kinase [Chthoniobacterales bacterium]
MQRGIFITFEGSEGCGKSTQIARLAEKLQQAGKHPVVIREPGGTGVGEQIRHILKYSKQSSAMTPEAELLLFTASRAQLVREVIQPALEEGSVVISDRFMDSTTVYQGVARKIDAAAVADINAFAVGSCVPNITFVMDMDAGAAFQRVLRRPRPVNAPQDRMEQEPLSFYEAVRAGYLKLAKENPGRMMVIDASRSPDEVQADILKTLNQHCHGLFV